MIAYIIGIQFNKIMLNFSTISQIRVAKEKTWNKKVFLTFDVDWAHDEVIEDTLSLLSNTDISSTWFITHRSNSTMGLQDNKNIESAIHPNFNFLLDGAPKENNLSATQVVEHMMEIVPDAKSSRSHSLTQNERLVDLLYASGITHLSNLFIPHNQKNIIFPFQLWDGVTVVPHCWQDNVSLKMRNPFPSVEILKNQFICLLFHPIHVFLNSESQTRYEKTRELHQRPRELIKHRFKGYGVRNCLKELIRRREVN